MNPRIVVIGSMNMDLVTRAPRLPAPGETIIGGEFLTAPGGKGANQAVAAARLGAQVSMVGRVGDDPYGEELLTGLRAAGVDTHHVGVDPQAHTGIAAITVTPGGENSIVVSPGANWRLGPADVEAAAQVIIEADMLLLQLEVQLAVVEQAVDLAREHEVPVLLNPAPARELPAGLLAKLDYLVPNLGEAALLAGHSVDALVDQHELAARLKRLGARRLVLTLGEKGAYCYDGLTHAEVPAFRVEPVDTTAAGDAFVASFAVGITRGLDMIRAARFGNAAGALATTRLGAQPSLPFLADVEALYNQELESP